MSSKEDFPYNLPKDVDSQIAVLADIVDIPAIKFRRVSREDAIKTLAGLILYRHLEKREEAAFNRHLDTLPRSLAHRVVLLRDQVLVQPGWGMWSLSTEELLEKKEFLSHVSTVATLFGVGVSIKSANDLWRALAYGTGNATAVGAAVIAGTVAGLSSWEEGQTDREIMERLR